MSAIILRRIDVEHDGRVWSGWFYVEHGTLNVSDDHRSRKIYGVANTADPEAMARELLVAMASEAGAVAA